MAIKTHLRGGYRIYASILKRDPDFFVHTGDIVYYDSRAKTLPLARWHWARMYSLPTNVAFHREVASYFIKDDHDTWMNDCWPGQQTLFMGEFTFEQGLTVFREQVGMGDRTYRTVRWGKDLQIWMVEGRDFRSPNPMLDGPEKTIWGKEQKAWFKETVRASDAAFRILISPTPVVGPDREKKNDNHANEGFTHEGDELRQFIAEQKIWSLFAVTDTGNTSLLMEKQVCENIPVGLPAMDTPADGPMISACRSTAISMSLVVFWRAWWSAKTIFPFSFSAILEWMATYSMKIASRSDLNEDGGDFYEKSRLCRQL